MHKLIAGTTLSGKSTLAKDLSALYMARGRQVLVLDELMAQDWHAALVTDNPDEFLEAFWNSRNLAVFIDEAGESVGRYNEAMSKTATRGRHWGHFCHYICQRPTMLGRNVRGQCSEVFAFTLDQKDADSLAEDFVQPELRKAPTLMQGEYIRAVRFGSDRKPFYQRGNAFA